MLKLEKIIDTLIKKRVSLLAWTLGFLAIIFLRCFIEQFIAVSQPIFWFESIIEYIHNFYFFALAFLLIWLFFSFLFKLRPQKLSGLLIFALALTLFPPIIDMLKNHGEVYWSFYLLSNPHLLWQQYWSIFGHLPSGIVYFGTKITFILAVLISAGLIWLKEKSYFKSILGALIVYSILFFMGAFPSFFVYGYDFIFHSTKILQIQSFQIAQFFGAANNVFGVNFPSVRYAFAYQLDFVYFPFLVILLTWFFWLVSPIKFLAFIKNLRLPQLIYHFGLFFIGLGLGILAYPQNFNLNLFSFLSILILMLSIWFSWEASVIINDIYDLPIDQISNSQRPLPQKIFTVEEYRDLGVIYFLLALLGAITISVHFAVLIIIYQILAWFYSAPPFRLKRFPFLATFISSLASVIILFIGYILMASHQSIATLSWRIPALLILSYTISLPIKDLKDIAGDRKHKIWTLPVIFGEKNSRLIIASGIFISYLASIFFLNELRLFSVALFFGIITFLIVINQKVKSSQLLYWVLALVFFYGFILVKVSFF